MKRGDALVDVLVPPVESDAPDAEIVAVHVLVGDAVAEGETLFEISYDKVDVVIDCPVTGIIAEVATSEGELVDPGQLLARIMPGPT